MRGRGGRGVGGMRGRGGARGASRDPTPSKVPRFPVVGGAGAHMSHDDDDDAPRPVSAHRPASAHTDDFEDAPPAAVSARRSGGGAEDTEERVVSRGRGGSGGRGMDRGGAGRGALRGGRGADRGGRGAFRGGGRGEGSFRGAMRGAGRGFDRGGRGALRGRGRGGGRPDASSDDDNDGDEEIKAVPKQSSTHVITTVTENGSEVPKKLNNKVFIDGLPYESKTEPGQPSLEDELIQFATAWKVGKPLRLLKKNGKGFGFLVFKSPHSVDTAVRVLNGRKFLGRTLRVAEPKPRDFESVNDVASLKDEGKTSFARQVLLTDLAKISEPEIIREVLRDVAPQMEKKLEQIKMTSNNRKAFLTFENEADVDGAVQFLDGFHLLGRKIGATRAARPGSLPYSRGPLHGSLARAEAEHANASGHAAPQWQSGAAQADEDDLVLVPLGAETTPAAKKANAAKNTATAATPAAGANVTGKTERYDLLDNGSSEIYVGHLTDDITTQHLREHFSSCGKIAQCELVVHPQTHLSTGIARIRFALPAYAAYAQEHMHGSRLRSCVLRVDRGGEASAPLSTEVNPGTNEDDDYDEDAYLARYGVTDKDKYFAGTSLATAAAGGDDDDDDDADFPFGRKRARKAESGKKGAPTTASTKKNKTEKAAREAKTFAAAEESDDDDEEHFVDADNVVVPAAADRAGQAGKSKNSASKAKDAKKAAKPTAKTAAKKQKK